MKFYAGIGSRETPAAVCRYMTDAARKLRERGYILRSGGAWGADTAFATGAGRNSRIYLPWNGFNQQTGIVCGDDPDLQELAAHYHPAWNKLAPPAKKLMARNGAQVMGYGDEQVTSDFIVCWTPDGRGEGGTGQAIRIAADLMIPIYDLGSPKDTFLFDEFLNSDQCCINEQRSMNGGCMNCGDPSY